jgi:hypothetical protein
MEREVEKKKEPVELIDLGAATIETLGPIGQKSEVSQNGHLTGISDE